MKTPREITGTQAAATLISTIIGVGVLSLPVFGVEAADTGAPLVTLLGILVSFIGMWVVTVLGMRFPDKTFIGYSQLLLGRFLSVICNVFVVVFFAQLTSMAAREFGEVVVTSVLRTTPLEVTVIVMLLLAAISTRVDLRTFAYIHLFYMPFILAPGLLIVVLSLKNADIVNLLPVTGNNPRGMITGILTVAALFQGFFIYTLIIPAMRKPEKAMKWSVWGILISGGLYLLIVVASVAVFGPEEVKKLIWPTLELAKTTSLPANVLERLDAAFLAVWVTAVFTTLLSSYYLTVNALSEMMRLQDHKLFSYAVLPLVFYMAMLPDNVVQLYTIIERIGRLGLLITIGYPALLLLIAVIRKKRSDSREA